MLHINLICCVSRYSHIPTMNGLATIEFQDNQPIMHKYNYYKYILWALNYVHTMMVTRSASMKQLHNSDCDIRNYFPAAKKSVENA